MNLAESLLLRKQRAQKALADKIFDTMYAREVDLYKPIQNESGHFISEDDDLYDEDLTGTTTNDRESVISYSDVGRTKIVQIKLDEDYNVTFTKTGDLNDYDPEANYKFIVQDDLPIQSIIQYEQLVSVNGDLQTMTLIKVDEGFIGKSISIRKVDIFVSYNGVL